MKIKFSIFLCLFPFTLSSPPLPYPDLLPSFIPIQPKYEDFPLFIIDGYGIYVWTIAYKPTLVTSVLVERNLKKHINMKLQSNKTYIVLKVDTNNECQAYYWVGENTALIKRKTTAYLVVKLLYDLGQQIPTSELKHLSREEQNKESYQFLFLFKKDVFRGSNENDSGEHNSDEHDKARPVPRLFKATGEDGDLFMEVPLRYNELNLTDTFVLDKVLFINVWNANPHDNVRKLDHAMALTRYITYVDQRALKKDIQVEIGYDSMNVFKHFTRRFLKVLEGVPSSFAFPKPELEPPSPITDHQFEKERNRRLRLFEYSIENDKIIWREISERPLTLYHFRKEKTYVMTDSYVDGIFVYIGTSVHYAQIEEVMVAAEIINWHMPNNKWKKVTLIRSSKNLTKDKLPTHFIINFPEVNNYLKKYMKV